MDDDRLAGRHVIVTGGARGIGRGIATRAARAGADVTIFDVDADAAPEAVESIEARGSAATALDVDVADADAVAAGLEEAVAALGPVDGLVNNAGVQRQSPVLETSGEDWDAHFEVNAKGTFLCSKLVGRHMVEAATEGAIVNVGSTAATGNPHPGQGAYAASKGAVAALTVVLAKELAEHGIRCNAIHPGGVDTPMVRRLAAGEGDDPPDELPPEVRERASENFLAGRMGRPDDLGHVAALLLSDEGEWITGQSFVVDGGVTHG